MALAASFRDGFAGQTTCMGMVAQPPIASLRPIPGFLAALLLTVGCLAGEGGGSGEGGAGGGAAGMSGAAGTTGVAGTTGDAGTTGVAGAAGSTGVAGTTGVAGAAGTTGVAGAAGTTGVAGAAGGTGVAGAGGRGGGAAGTTGAAGAAGRGGAAGTGTGGVTGAAGTGVAGTTGAGNNTGGNGFYRMERLNRGVVAVTATGGVYVGWRMFGFEYDAANPSNVSYNVYRNGTMVGSVTNSTNYLDSGGSASSTYTVRAVIGGVVGGDSETATVWAQQYLRIPLMVPPGGNTPSSCATANQAYTYSANDASAGDLDGDGVYEIILKWDPSNAKDNSQSGCTGNVYMDAYKLNGTRMWRIDLGQNIRAGAHYTQFVVFDFDSDGRAEMAVKTAPGTRDGTGAYLSMGPAANDDDAALYRSINNTGGRTGFILTGPEYLTVFNGMTGAEMATIAFDQARGTVSSWGDD